ncbi:MAG: hypothetical protein ACLP50_29300 [Solirubrobacteraceae bacterium]
MTSTTQTSRASLAELHESLGNASSAQAGQPGLTASKRLSLRARRLCLVPGASAVGQARQGDAMNAKAVTVSFAPGITATQKQALTGMGLSYLQEHMSDAENVSGQWSRVGVVVGPDV